MAKYTASLTVTLTPVVADEVYQAAIEEEVGPSVMGRRLIEDGLEVPLLRAKLLRSDDVIRAEYGSGVDDDWNHMSPEERAEYIRRASGDES